jgi:hypothetical protein
MLGEGRAGYAQTFGMIAVRGESLHLLSHSSRTRHSRGPAPLVLIALCALVFASAGCGAAGPTSLTRFEPGPAVGGLRVASIDGVRSSRCWLQADGASLEATGFTGGSLAVVSTPRGNVVVCDLFIAETAGPMTLYHVVPLCVRSDAVVTVDGQRLSAAQLEKLGTDPSVEFNPMNGQASATFVLEGPWAWATSLTVNHAGDLPSDAQGTSPLAVSAPTAAPDAPWLSIRQGETVGLTAYPGGSVSGSDESSSYSWQFYYVPDRLGDTTVYHQIALDSAAEGPSNQGAPPRAVEIRVRLDGARFVPGE